MKEEIDTDCKKDIKDEKGEGKFNVSRISCDKCNIQFPDNQALRDHRKKHDQRSFSCLNCGKQFTGLRLFQNHMRKYKLFTCEVCGKDWPVGNKIRHMKNCIFKKEEIKPKKEKENYVCNFCEYNTLHKRNFERHIDRLHTKISCSNCKQEFDNHAKLRNHISFYHPKPKKDPEIKQCKWPNCSFKSKHSKSIKRHEKENCPNRPDASISFIWF